MRREWCLHCILKLFTYNWEYVVEKIVLYGGAVNQVLSYSANNSNCWQLLEKYFFATTIVSSRKEDLWWEHIYYSLSPHCWQTNPSFFLIFVSCWHCFIYGKHFMTTFGIPIKIILDFLKVKPLLLIFYWYYFSIQNHFWLK